MNENDHCGSLLNLPSTKGQGRSGKKEEATGCQLNTASCSCSVFRSMQSWVFPAESGVVHAGAKEGKGKATCMHTQRKAQSK